MIERVRFYLGTGDPTPVEVVGADLTGGFFLTCEHAGRAVPKCLGDLGVHPSEMERHIAFDVGAEAVARQLSVNLQAQLYIQRYSRLVIDCNRPLAAEDCIPVVSDGTEIPCNRDLSTEDREARYIAIHEPYHQAVKAAIDRVTGTRTFPLVLLAIHSFTPVMRRTGETRECELGLLFNRDDRFARAMLLAVTELYPDIKASLNDPYTVDDLSDFTIPVHGETRRIPHVLIEIRNDLISDEESQSRWAAIIAEISREAVKRMEPEYNGL